MPTLPLFPRRGRPSRVGVPIDVVGDVRVGSSEMRQSVDALLAPRSNVAARDINDGAVLVNMGSGACFELNRIGFEIWKLLGPGTTVASICEALAGRYAVEPEVLAADVRSLVDALMGAGLVQTVAPGGTSKSQRP